MAISAAVCMLLAGAVVVGAVGGADAATKPHIIHVVADDLGYNDLGIRNGGKTITPTIDSLIQGGVSLRSYYTFRVCAPTRASIMTGRYPWGIGYYDMSDDSHHCVDPKFKMIPAVLNPLGYRSHAIGKWDVGMVLRECLPTYRGFLTFLGYYTACTADYWLHGAPGAGAALGPCNDVDFHDSVGDNVAGAKMSGPGSVNGTYDQVVFTQRAVDLIEDHAANHSDTSLFIYLAYHNVHDACQKDRFTAGLNAPKETVDLYPTTILDTWKVQAAMTTELDYGVANVTAALKATGMWSNTVLVLVSDNGGPLDHSTNSPLRGGKATEWEGGYRVEAFVHSPLFSASVVGTEYWGMMHSSDWYVTYVEGVAGGVLPADTGPRPPDGHNLWEAITGRNLTSPRTEVIHAVQNQYFNSTGGKCDGCKQNVGVQAARFGDMKIIIGASCTASVVAWPEPSPTPVPFGKTTGWVREGTNWAYSGLLDGANVPDSDLGQPDPTCATGIIGVSSSLGEFCCDKACGQCGCPGGVPHGTGTKDGCCYQEITASHKMCSDYPPPCIMHNGTGLLPGCLYNVTADLSEANNLRNDPAYADMWNDLVALLKARGATGPPLTSAFPLGEKNATTDNVTCNVAKKTGFLFPVDY